MPEVHSISPVAGSVVGGTEITIVGKNFLSLDMIDHLNSSGEESPKPVAPIKIKIGHLICPKVAVVSDTELRAVTPFRLPSEQEIREDREYDLWEAWQLSPRKIEQLME